MNSKAKTVRHPRLFLYATLFVLFYTIALSLAPAIRVHSTQISIDWKFFIPFLGWFLAALGLNHAVNRYLPSRDPWIFPSVMLLSGWGLLTIWRLYPSLGQRQVIWFLLGCLIFYAGLRRKDLITWLKSYKYIWLILGLFLIALTIWIGVNPSGSGPTRWLNAFGLYFQPSEPLKLLILIYLAAFFADQVRPNTSLLSSILPTLIIIIITGGLLMSQRDLGTAVLFLAFYTLMLSVTTNSRKFLWIIPIIIIMAVVVGYFTIDIVKTRVDIWLNPWLNPSGSSYQIAQAQIAIASGGLFGAGPGLGSPNIVPVSASDFIFTAIAEETGLLGTSALLLIYVLIVIRGISIAIDSKTTFGRYLAFGISMFLALQSMWIIGANLGIFPLSGVTLPFMSYGGSSLLTSLIAVLLLLKISSDSSAIPLPDKTRKPYQVMAAVLLSVFVLTIAWNSTLAIFNRDRIVQKPVNPRWAINDRYSPLGNILDQSGQTIVRTIGTPGDFERELLIPSLSTTIGYTTASLGQSGLERSLYPYLRGFTTRSAKAISQHQLLYNHPPAGGDIKLNLLLDFQIKADELMEGKRGAVVILNANTGEIYTLSSHPYYDHQNIAEDWESWRNREDAPLLNRATQSAYPIGTLANSLILSSYWVQQGDDPLNVPIYDTTSDFHCAKAMRQRGEFTGIQHGCEKLTNDLIRINKPSELVELFDDFGLYSKPNLSLEQAIAHPMPQAEEFEQLQTRLPETHVSPLQMALVAASITNDGLMVNPRLINAYSTENGTWKNYTEAGTGKQIIPARVAQRLIELLKYENQAYWYAIGHSFMENGEVLTWLIGGTTKDWAASPLAIAIAIEGSQVPLAYRIAEAFFVPEGN